MHYIFRRLGGFLLQLQFAPYCDTPLLHFLGTLFPQPNQLFCQTQLLEVGWGRLQLGIVVGRLKSQQYYHLCKHHHHHHIKSWVMGPIRSGRTKNRREPGGPSSAMAGEQNDISNTSKKYPSQKFYIKHFSCQISCQHCMKGAQ